MFFFLTNTANRLALASAPTVAFSCIVAVRVPSEREGFWVGNGSDRRWFPGTVMVAGVVGLVAVGLPEKKANDTIVAAVQVSLTLISSGHHLRSRDRGASHRE